MPSVYLLTSALCYSKSAAAKPSVLGHVVPCVDAPCLTETGAALCVPEVPWWKRDGRIRYSDLLTKQGADGVVMRSARMWKVTPFTDEGSLRLTRPGMGTCFVLGGFLIPVRISLTDLLHCAEV